MQHSRQLEIKVGLFVLIGLAALLFIALDVANVTRIGQANTYQLQAHFDNIGSLKVRSPVKVGGVVIGEVSSITLDPERFIAVVKMDIDSQYDQFTDSTSVEILTAGLIGEQYLSLVPGFWMDDSEFLANGDVIADTKSAIVLENLIGQFLYRTEGE